MRRIHGEEAVRHAEKNGGQLKMYADHEPGRLAGCEEIDLTIDQANGILETMPFLVFIDIKEDSHGTSTG